MLVSWRVYFYKNNLTFPETNSSPLQILQMDGWNTSFLLGRTIFRGYVSFREGSLLPPCEPHLNQGAVAPSAGWHNGPLTIYDWSQKT